LVLTLVIKGAKMHIQKKMVMPNGEVVLIDKGIFSLIKKLNQLNIRTVSCCESICDVHHNRKYTYRYEIENGKKIKIRTHKKTKHCKKHVWICLESPDDQVRFMNIIYRKDWNPKYSRLENSRKSVSSKMIDAAHYFPKRKHISYSDSWFFDVAVYDDGKDTEAKFALVPRLFIPKSDLKEVERRVNEAIKNDKQRKASR
jgi:hypothetical protein